MIMKKIQIASIALLFAVSVSANNYYVKMNGADVNNGTSWNLAKNDLQNAINHATAGDTIFVAAGVYSGGFIMREGINVMGGYTANPEKPRERILPADAVNDVQWSILDGGNKQRTLTQIADFATQTVWDGFVVRNGIPVKREIAAGYLVHALNGANIVAVVYQYNPTTETGKMISVADIQSSWGGYQTELSELPCLGSAADGMNGVENTEIIVEKFGETNPDFKDNYMPNGNYAANWCKELSIGGFTGWHLPSADEWQEVFAQKNAINNAMIPAKKHINGYWTSNHAGNLLAWAFYLENGKMKPTLKYIEKNVRAIRSFQKSELPAITAIESSVFLQNNGTLKNCFVDNMNVNYVDFNNAQAQNCVVFPNPANDFVYIGGFENEDITVYIYNLAGGLVKQTNRSYINVSDLNNGIYLLKLTTKTNTVVRKLVIVSE